MRTISKYTVVLSVLIAASLALALVKCGCTGGGGGTAENGGGTGAGDDTGGTGEGTLGLCSWDSKPAKGVPCADPEFGTAIARMTDKSVDAYSGPGIENEYARSDPENSDGSLLVLRGNDGQWYLYNASTFALIRHLEGIADGGQEIEPRWDASDPKKFYYLSGLQLRSYNVDTQGSAVVHDFSGVMPGAKHITTGTEGEPSMEGRYWCFMMMDYDAAPNPTFYGVITYDKQTNSVLGQKTAGFTDAINWVSMDMSGAHCVIGYEDSDTDGDDQTPPVEVFSRNNLSAPVSTLPVGCNGHMDLALDASGRDVMIYQKTQVEDWIAMADILTGAETLLIRIPFGLDEANGITVFNTDIGLHFSGNNSAHPGWALVSTYGSKNVPTSDPVGQSHTWMDNLLFMIELKADPQIKKIAHTNAFTSLNYDGEKNYFAEAFATINKRGTKVYFGSNWSDFSNPEYSDTYAAVVSW